MSHDKRYPHATAMAIANELVALLRPHVERIGIAGSLRRGKADVGDIELLVIPKFDKRKTGLFDTDVEYVSLFDMELDVWLKGDVIRKRPSATGVFTWGKENKLGIHVPSGIPVDFFSTDAERWWVALVIRTGGKETNLALTTGAQRLGRQLHAYGNGVTHRDGSKERAISEKHVFELCGVPYVPPNKRK